MTDKKKPRISMKGLKAKGDKFERELAKHMATATGLVIERAPLSGGGCIGQLSGGADLIGTTGLHIEAKRVEKLNFLDAMRQAERSIEKQNAPEFPVVVNRRNHMALGESVVAMRLDQFLVLYSGWLANEGITKSGPVDDPFPF